MIGAHSDPFKCEFPFVSSLSSPPVQQRYVVLANPDPSFISTLVRGSIDGSNMPFTVFHRAFNVDGNAIIFCVYFKAIPPSYRYHKTVQCRFYLPKLKAFAFCVLFYFFYTFVVRCRFDGTFKHLEGKSWMKQRRTRGIYRSTYFELLRLVPINCM